MALDDGGSGPTTTVAGPATTGSAAISQTPGGVVEIVIDAAQVEVVNQHLMTAQHYLDGAKATLATISAGAVGGSPVGQQLAHHSGLAHDALTSTLSSMEEGLTLYRDNIRSVVDSITDIDQGAASTSRTGEACIPAATSASTPAYCGGS